MRLQKFLSAAGVCSRRRGEEYINAGRIRVNGQVVTLLGTKIDPVNDRITVDGNPVQLAENLIYIALNKPRGYVTSCDHPGEKTVLDLVNVPERVFPIGRLDKDSTGLLILTNDGPLHHRLAHPSFDHEKEYEVTVDRPIPDSALERIQKGLPLMGTVTRPAQVQRLSAVRFRIVLKEGRNRQIRRMVRKVGGHVKALRRIRMADVRLGSLREGDWRHLSETEMRSLKKEAPAPDADG
jgi:23S rRNA pseudouridine2605 synthase/23S rRNA pseudouridine2604 synthase